MGSQQFYPDEGPVHDQRVAPFAIEQHPVTNAQFRSLWPKPVT